MTSMSRVAPERSVESGDGATSRRRRWRPRWSLTHLVMVVAGLLAFVAVMAVLRDREVVVQIPVVLSDVAAGDPVAEGDVGMVRVRGPSPGLTEAAVTADELEAAGKRGLVAARFIPAASLISSVDLAEPGEVSAARTMSVPVSSTDGVGRSLARGDVVDIIAVVDGLAAFIATDVPVVGVVSSGQPATGTVAVNVEVDATSSLRLAWAMSRTEVRFVRATGAPLGDPTAVYPDRAIATDDD